MQTERQTQLEPVFTKHYAPNMLAPNTNLENICLLL